MTATYLSSTPYPWPFDGDLRPDNTALIIIDMQTAIDLIADAYKSPMIND